MLFILYLILSIQMYIYIPILYFRITIWYMYNNIIFTVGKYIDPNIQSINIIMVYISQYTT